MLLDVSIINFFVSFSVLVRGKNEEFNKNILERKDNACAKATEICKNKFQENTDVITVKVTTTEQDSIGEIISPEKLTQKTINTILKEEKALTEKRSNSENTNNQKSFKETILDLLFQVINPVRCEVINSVSKSMISYFYLFTFNESGYPTFILTSKLTDLGKGELKKVSYVSSVMYVKDGANSSTSHSYMT